ncbi:MAG: FAD-binding protein [Bacillota bacterium]
MPGELARQLARVVGTPWVLDSQLARHTYAYDASPICGLPDLVVLPANREELAAVVSICNRQGVPVVPRGAGTSLSGGPVATSGGVVIALTRMNRILTVDPENRVALVEPGVTNMELQQAASRWGLMFGPDPASGKVATLGGNAAENAGGPRAARYGVTRQHVLGLEFVLPDGTLASTGQLGPVPCPDIPRPLLELGSLMVGSEGTLAFVTRLALLLVPSPRNHATLLAFFPAVEEAATAVSRIVAAGMLPAALEIMGRLDITLVEKSLHLGIPVDAEAMLLLEFDGPGPALAKQVRCAEQIMRESGAVGTRSATDPREREDLWLARRAASGMYGLLKPTYLSQDVTVPRHRVPEMFRKVAELARESKLPISIMGHLGDGNLHPAVLLDDRCPREMEQALEVCHVVVEEALRLGGTLSGEHGIGVEKLEFMPLAFSPATLRYFAEIKRAFDPRWTLNPGKLLPPPTPGSAAPATDAPASGAGVTPERVLGELEALLGRRLLTSGEDLRRFGFDAARSPWAVAVPESAEELTETVRILAARGVKIWPIGGGTLVSVAFSPFEGGVAVSTAGLDRVVDLIPENLTATVQVGCHPDDLNASAAAASCLYAVDCWRLPKSTLGGEVGINGFGPRRPRYGSTRDNLLGLTFLDASGQVCRVGGQTIKNVSGYDATRLLCGAWGILGIAVEATVRLWPRPEEEETVAVPVRDPAGLGPFLTDLFPAVDVAALQLLSPCPGKDNWLLLLALAGPGEDVQWWINQLYRCSSHHGLEPRPLAPDEAARWWEEARRRSGPAACHRLRPRPCWVAGYMRVKPTSLPAAAAFLFRTARDRGWECGVNAFCTLGVIDFTLSSPAGEAPAGIAELLHHLTGAAPGGELGLYGWGADLERAMLPWLPGRAYPAGTAKVVTRLKGRLDPAGILAPAARILPATLPGGGEPHAGHPTRPVPT